MLTDALMFLPRKMCKHIHAFGSLQTLVHLIKAQKVLEAGHFLDWDTS